MIITYLECLEKVAVVLTALEQTKTMGNRNYL
jgi:hypothetical protein